MPFYEYACESCGKEFETLARTMEAAAPPCPQCGGSKVTRKLSVFAVSAPSAPAPAPGCAGCGQFGSCPNAR